MNAYFRDRIFVACPEHVTIVAYYLDFCGLIFRFGALRNKTKPANGDLTYTDFVRVEC